MLPRTLETTPHPFSSHAPWTRMLKTPRLNLSLPHVLKHIIRGITAISMLFKDPILTQKVSLSPKHLCRIPLRSSVLPTTSHPTHTCSELQPVCMYQLGRSARAQGHPLRKTPCH